MGGNKMKGGDSLQRRNANEDSITIFYRMYDSSRIHFIDSSVSDFTARFPLPASHLYLGSLGSASHSALFEPNLKPGFDAGFHGFDAYRYNVENTRVFQTTRPYSELDYILGSRSEQTIKVLHTQNITPTWNGAFEFRFANSPGNFKNNNASHSNIRLSSGFSTKKRRYSGNFMYITNKGAATQNGGILSDTFLTSTNKAYYQRFNIPTWLGGDGSYGTNFFASGVTTGFRYKELTFFYRHQYDFGQKDSIVNAEDSTVTHLFYPRFRLQHTLSYHSQQYNYFDNLTTDTSYTKVYYEHFGLKSPKLPINMKDSWKDISNEVAFIAYPQKTNQDQFFKAGAGYQYLHLSVDSFIKHQYSNLYLLAEYRNRTKNQRWDINAFGRLYMAGLNAGDYTAAITLETKLGKHAGALLLGFQNTSRTPSFMFDTASAFINQTKAGLKQENWTHFSGHYVLPQLKLKLNGDYYLVGNYTYWNSYTTFSQEATITSVLHVSGEKKFRLNKHWNWYAELHVQTETSDVINLPLVYTRNRFAYEGTFFKNLNLSTGIEVRYFTPFKADDWSPFNGQWVVQNKETISNRPDIGAYLHFRIKSFRLYTRLDNLNTLDLSRGFQFLNNNLSAPLYPTPGLFFRLGIYWSFVN